MGNDVQFHWQQILEIMRSNKLIPELDFHTLSLNGSALSTMYPYLFLYPFIAIFHFTHSVITTSYVVYFCNTLISLLISYFTSLKLSKSKLISYIFSIMYSISLNLLFSMFYEYDMGITFTLIFLPLVIFGFIYYLKNGKWLMLSIGMSCIIYCSVISSAFIPILLFLFLLYNYKLINEQKIINLFKAIILTLLTTALFWIPALKLLILNNLNTPTVKSIQGTNPLIYFGTSLIPIKMLTRTNGTTIPFTIYAILGIVFGILLFNHLSQMEKKLYIFSIIIFILGLNIIPWNSISNIPGLNFLKTIQYPSRIYIIPQLLLTYFSAKYLVHIIHHKHLVRNLGLILICVFGIQFYNQKTLFKLYSPSYSTPTTTSLVEDSKNYFSPDYYPKSSLKFKNDLSKQNGFYDKSHKIHFTLNQKKDCFYFKNKTNIKKLYTPFLYYYGVNYKYYLNNKLIKTTHSNQLTTLHTIGGGKNNLKIEPQNSNTIILSRIITIANIFTYIIVIIKHLNIDLIHD